IQLRRLLMQRFGLLALAALGLFVPSSRAADEKWATIKGQIVWDGEVPKQPKITPTANADVCAKDKMPLEEDYIVNPNNKGVKNVFVWIRPTGLAKDDPFPKDKINPALAKPPAQAAEIDQPCCRFIPHVLAAREGQAMIIKNGAPIAHNAKW